MAIPAGIYDAALTYFASFQKDILKLLRVPGFEGIRIPAADTAGCLLTGTAVATDNQRIFNSWRAYHALLLKLEAAIGRTEAVRLITGYCLTINTQSPAAGRALVVLSAEPG
jgi:hypothetical protein